MKAPAPKIGSGAVTAYGLPMLRQLEVEFQEALVDPIVVYFVDHECLGEHAPVNVLPSEAEGTLPRHYLAVDEVARLDALNLVEAKF